MSVHFISVMSHEEDDAVSTWNSEWQAVYVTCTNCHLEFADVMSNGLFGSCIPLCAIALLPTVNILIPCVYVGYAEEKEDIVPADCECWRPR
jgi:protein-arginine kinase activator protein McsA